MKQKPEEKKTVGVEELLRLKRAERPSPEFWAGWQGGMRQKLSTAAQEKPSWRHRQLPRFWLAIARWHLPLGATAAAALCFVAVREYNASVQALGASPRLIPANIQAQSAVVQAPVANQLLSELRQETPKDVSAASSSADIVSSVALLAPSEELRSRQYSRTARVIAANLESARRLDPELDPEIKPREAMFSVTSSTEEPLAKIVASRDLRRERLLGAYPSMAYVPGASSEVEKEPARNFGRLSEEQLTNDNLPQRLKARGDKLSFRF